MCPTGFVINLHIPKASEEEIQELETRISTRLPPDFREYLKNQNGTMPLKRDYRMPGEENWIESVFEMYGLLPEGHPRSVWQFLEGDWGIPAGWLPIANSGYGDYTVISLLEKDFGSIYYIFHEVHGFDSNERFEGVYFLAPSFDDWIDGLEDLSGHYEI